MRSNNIHLGNEEMMMSHASMVSGMMIQKPNNQQ
jgi:hypothetical protein